jgi:hypothetical protein
MRSRGFDLGSSQGVRETKMVASSQKILVLDAGLFLPFPLPLS